MKPLFRLVSREDLPALCKVLHSLLPRTRKLTSALQLELRGFDTGSDFYVPAQEESHNLSGMVVSLSRNKQRPDEHVTYFSKQEDVEKVLHLYLISALKSGQIFLKDFEAILQDFEAILKDFEAIL